MCYIIACSLPSTLCWTQKKKTQAQKNLCLVTITWTAEWQENNPRHNPREAKTQTQIQVVWNMKNSKNASFKHKGSQKKEDKTQGKSLFPVQQKGKINQVDALKNDTELSISYLPMKIRQASELKTLN